MANATITIALAGNPNSGKTTIFNALTGANQHVGNWPGVTVEKKEGRLKTNKEVVLQDLPGIYSLAPYSPEEVITRNYLVKEQPGAIIDIVDASNLERNLYLTTQLTELGIPVVLALNMSDVVTKRGDRIDVEKLSNLLGVAVVETSATQGLGLTNAVDKAVWLAEEHASHKHGLDPEHDHSHDLFQAHHRFAPDVETALTQISDIIAPQVKDANVRWYSIKLFERDADAIGRLALSAKDLERIQTIIDVTESKFSDDGESVIANERYAFISRVIDEALTLKDANAATISDKIDHVVTNRILALPIFALVMFLVYFISISTVGTWMTDWVNDVLFGELVPGPVTSWLEGAGTADWLNSLILDGIIAGVGAVLGFLPQMLVLFLLLALLEECGYMARIAFIMDRVFRRFGLSGKSFIPILIGTGCGVPGILASRTIENETNRRLTVMTTTFIPCSAKLPIIALIAGALFPGSLGVMPASVLIATSAYFIGIAAIITSGILLKKTRLFAGDTTPFLIELPAYHVPRVPSVLRIMLERGWAFVKRAATIILLATMLVWFLSSFSWSMEMVDADQSMLAAIGSVVAPIFDPLGWGDWRATTATFTGLIAKENVVGTFGVLYGFGEVSEDGAEYWPLLIASFTQLSAFSFLLFNLLCAPCFAAIGAIRREMASWKWTVFAVGYECVFAYAIAFIVYQSGLLIAGKGFTITTAIALILLVAFIYLLVRRPYDPTRANNKKAAQGTTVA
ncbi:MAG: ferrous iron transport protein B [Coriobacteriales bacterium]|jgi:ferrous iron transport protein B|nr:ferrous iron transport protein B [Coriobacteriales bacterium]